MYVKRRSLQVASALADLLEREILGELSLSASEFWKGVEEVLEEFTPRNEDLLARRKALRKKLDQHYQERCGTTWSVDEEVSFLSSIGYLDEEPEGFRIAVGDLDPEVADIAGPQLVVPVDNARYATNAINARWGSLYDALYGSNIIPDNDKLTKSGSYNPARGAVVIDHVTEFLDDAIPLNGTSHSQATRYRLSEEKPHHILVDTQDGVCRLGNAAQFRGYRGNAPSIEALLFENNGLCIELVLDDNHSVGKVHPAGVADVVLESALTTILDFEDSVSAVDSEDKCRVYENCLQIIRGDIEAEFIKDGKNVIRTINSDRSYIDPMGESISQSGRSLALIRNVGLHMYTDVVLDQNGRPVPEGIVDGFVTAVIGMLDVRGLTRFRNSESGSIYIVKPKLHGVQEVSFAVELFDAIEQKTGLPGNTIKIGIMDEERRTSLNLGACVHAARERVFFINTGFLDRTGDEIRTLMFAGPVPRKKDIKTAEWLAAYESLNVSVGLDSGFAGVAQIGKGMWAEPDNMSAMLTEKIAQPEAGASTGWIPSPSAATIHATHYHRVSVRDRQKAIEDHPDRNSRSQMLVPAMISTGTLLADEIQSELRNNAQSILGYVVRWVHHGVGCSTVPDINDVGLMEDRATLRISSQHIANWVQHKLISRGDVVKTFTEVAALVDKQNRSDPEYLPLTSPSGMADGFRASLDLVDTAIEQPNGYTEDVLHDWRKSVKVNSVTYE